MVTGVTPQAGAVTPGGKPSRAAYMREYRKNKKREAAAAKMLNFQPLPAQVFTSPLGHVVSDWASVNLYIPTGPLAGKPFRVEDWQRDFLVDALGPNIREAGLSVARKNGKSGLVAVLALAYLLGPLNQNLWRGVVVSLTGALAGELRDQIEATASASGLADTLAVKRYPPPGEITGLNGSRLTILASDKATGHALGADLAIVDEAGLLDEGKRDLWNAVYSSTSGRNGRLVAISILGDSPLFAELRDRAADPAVVWHEYSAPADCDLDDVQAWGAANPGLASGIKARQYMEDASRKAIASPGDAASFRAYDLNQPRNPSDELLASIEDWRACETEDLPERSGRCVVGFDIGGSNSLTALVALWPDTGRMEAWAACGDNPALLDRSRSDGAGDSYTRMESRGELQTYPGRVTPAGAFLADCADRLTGQDVIVAGADRYRRAEVEDALDQAGLSWSIEWRGQGAAATADGSFDVRAMQRLILAHRVKVAPSLLLRQAVSESVIRRDGAGNPALDKRRQKGRIDAMSAAVIAAGLAEMYGKPVQSRGYLGLV